MGKGCADVVNHADRLVSVEHAALARREQLAERTAAQQLHREKRGIAVAIEFVHSHDVRMREGLQMLKLTAQLEEQLRALRDLRVQHFDGQILTGLRQIDAIQIHGFEYRAHATLAQYADDSIPSAQHVANGRRARGRGPCRARRRGTGIGCGGDRFGNRIAGDISADRDRRVRRSQWFARRG